MAKARWFGKGQNDVLISCPGCNEDHVLHVVKDVSTKRPCWQFNGDMNRPTFTPSLLVRTGKYANKAWYDQLSKEDKQWADKRSNVCHSFITSGKIRYLNDCTHQMKGQTVDLFDV